MENKINFVEDIYGNTLYLEENPVGRGGQGFVFRTKDNNIAVKLLAKNEQIIEDKELAKKYSEIVEEAIILDLPNNINVCRPETVLKPPYCGYTMKLLNSSSLVSIKDAFTAKTYKELNAKFPLKKRIEVLIELSRTMAVLHSYGLVYCDLSPNNVLFTLNSNSFSKVWLIDCDNIRKSCDVQSSIYTPGYGAPELVNGSKHNSVYSDVYSFAAVAFKVLTGINPFYVDYNNNGEASTGGWDDTTIGDFQDNQIMDEIYFGDPDFAQYEDVKNRFRLCLTNHLVDMFANVFSKSHKNDINSRPPMNEWYKALIQLYASVVNCKSCNSSISLGSATCPNCDSKIDLKAYRKFLVVKNGYSRPYIDKLMEIIQDDNEYTMYKNLNGEIADKEGLRNSLFNCSFKKNNTIVLGDGRTIYSFEIFKNTINDFPLPLLSVEITASESIILRTQPGLSLCNENGEDLDDTLKVEKDKTGHCYIKADMESECVLTRLEFFNK